jgi:hypothetical protein
MLRNHVSDHIRKTRTCANSAIWGASQSYLPVSGKIKYCNVCIYIYIVRVYIYCMQVYIYIYMIIYICVCRNDNHWIYHQQYKYDRIYQPKRKYNVRKKHREPITVSTLGGVSPANKILVISRYHPISQLEDNDSQWVSASQLGCITQICWNHPPDHPWFYTPMISLWFRWKVGQWPVFLDLVSWDDLWWSQATIND